MDLFETLGACLNPASRSSDPITSFEAEDSIKKPRVSICKKILPILIKNQGLTCRELAAKTPFDYHQLHKRLPDLKSAGLAVTGEARKCSIGKRNAQTWYAENDK